MSDLDGMIMGSVPLGQDITPIQWMRWRANQHKRIRRIIRSW